MNNDSIGDTLQVASVPHGGLLLAGRPPKLEVMTRKFMIGKALNNSRRFDIFHPSAWGSCLRKIAYQYYNEASPFVEKTASDVDLRIERIFDLGHSTHARWQNYLDCAGLLRGYWKCPNPNCGMTYGHSEKLGIFNPMRANKDFKCQCGNSKKLEYEEILIKSEATYNFEGHCDAVVDLRHTEFAQNNDFDVYVVDFKTMKDEMYSELTEPKHEHVIQVQIYMWVLDLRAAVVCYENKDNQALKEMFVPRDDQLIEKIKQQAVWMKELLKSNKLPHRPSGFSRSKFPCRLCEFVDFCYR